MWNWVSSSRLIHTPTSIGITWMPSSSRIAGTSSRYGRGERPSRWRRPGPVLRGPGAGRGSSSVRRSPPPRAVVVVVMRSCGVGLRRHLLLGLCELLLHHLFGDRLAAGGVGEEVLHRGADQGLELALLGDLGQRRGAGAEDLLEDLLL